MLVGLLEHDPVCRGGVEDLLEHNIGDVGYQSNHWQNDRSHVGFGRHTGVPDLSRNLRLEEEGDIRGVHDHHGDIVECHAEKTRAKRNPVPMHCLNINLNADYMHYHREGYTRGEPMRLSLSVIVSRPSQPVDSAEVSGSSMPDSENNPSPEDF